MPSIVPPVPLVSCVHGNSIRDDCDVLGFGANFQGDVDGAGCSCVEYDVGDNAGSESRVAGFDLVQGRRQARHAVFAGIAPSPLPARGRFLCW